MYQTLGAQGSMSQHGVLINALDNASESSRTSSTMPWEPIVHFNSDTSLFIFLIRANFLVFMAPGSGH